MGRIGTGATAALLCLAAPHPGAQESGTVTVSGPVAQAIDEYLTRCVPFGFSGSILAVKGGAVILSKGYGVADRTTGAPCTPATIYDLGQLAQPLTACLVLVLEQQKKLRTRDALEAFVPGVPSDKKKILLHHLLTHTSGLPRTLPSVAVRVATREELLAISLRVALRDPPGSQFTPTDAGYALLAAVVELVTKKPFEDALRELVLQPAGLASTGFRQDTSLDATRVARARAQPDEPPRAGELVTRLPDENATEEHELASEGWYSWGLRGAGGILSTVEDVWRFEQALRGEALLTRESRKKLFTPELASFAYGWQLQKEKPARIECRGWTTSGFGARCARFPDDGGFLVVLSNARAALDGIERDVRALLSGGAVTLPPVARSSSRDSLAAFAGEYEAPEGALWRVLAAEDALFLEARTAPALALHAGKLGGDRKRILKLSTAIVVGLASSDFGPLHEVDRGRQQLGGIEDWWRDLVTHHGALRSSTLLGLVAGADELDHALALLEFERGEELLDLRWSDEHLLGVATGPPHASCLRLLADGERSFVAYDLVRRERTATATFGEDGSLALELPGGKLVARKR